MRHKFPVLTVKTLLKSVSIYGSYRKNKTGVPFFGTPCIYMCSWICFWFGCMENQSDSQSLVSLSSTGTPFLRFVITVSINYCVQL